MHDEALFNLEKRIIVLEERTRPIPKTVADRIKDWAGVGTLIVALIYTFPLGVWDRFIVTREQKHRQQVDDLRSLVLKLGDKDAEYAKTISSITDPNAKVLLSRVLGSIETALVYQSYPLVDRNAYIDLSIPELILLGYDIGRVGNTKTADKILNRALALAGQDNNISILSDIYRIKGSLYIAKSDSTSLANLRYNLNHNIELLLSVPTIPNLLQASNTAFEWGSMELSYGDWKCGRTLVGWGIDTISKLPKIGEVPFYENQFKAQEAQFSKRVGQPEEGCPNEYLTWLNK